MTASKDEMVVACLRRVQRGDVAAAGMLVDYLEETGQGPWKRLRKLWATHERAVALWSNPELDFTRRWYTRWEAVAWERRDLRRKVARLFGRKWKGLPLEKFK